jgi:hypothetical protein
VTDDEKKAAWLGFAAEVLARLGETPDGQQAVDEFVAATAKLGTRFAEVAPGLLPKLVRLTVVAR